MTKLIESTNYKCKECSRKTFKVIMPSMPHIEEIKPILDCINCGTINRYSDYIEAESVSDPKPELNSYDLSDIGGISTPITYTDYDYWD